jgi:hypothetical protein
VALSALNAGGEEHAAETEADEREQRGNCQ